MPRKKKVEAPKIIVCKECEIQLTRDEDKFLIDGEVYCKKCFKNKVAKIQLEKKRKASIVPKENERSENTIVITPSKNLRDDEMIRVNYPNPSAVKPVEVEEKPHSPSDQTILDAVFKKETN